jgi:hypothetical protein
MSSIAYSRRQTYAPVYIVDMRQLYMRLMQTNSDRLVEIISAFGLGKANEWCAGNEAVYVSNVCLINSRLLDKIFSRLIIHIWRSMVSGVAIDEQRTQREVGVSQAPLEPKFESSADAGPSSFGGDDSDDERDPNDIQVIPGPSAPTTGGAYSNLDESDYDPQSDDSD